jgi:hypothetical protein
MEKGVRTVKLVRGKFDEKGADRKRLRREEGEDGKKKG